MRRGIPFKVKGEANLYRETVSYAAKTVEKEAEKKVLGDANRRMEENEDYVAKKGYIVEVCARSYCQLDFVPGTTKEGRSVPTEFVLNDITKSDLSGLYGVPDTLYDSVMGLGDESSECSTCGLDTCGGHKALIKLPTPIFNSLSIGLVMDIIACTCLKCKHLVYSPEAIRSIVRGATSPLENPRLLALEINADTSCPRGCGSIFVPSKIKKIDSQKMGTIVVVTKSTDKTRNKNMMTAEQVLAIFNGFEIEEVNAIGFENTDNLSSLILTHVVVIPTINRQYKVISGGVEHDELTKALANIIEERNKYNAILDLRERAAAPSAEEVKEATRRRHEEKRKRIAELNALASRLTREGNKSEANEIYEEARKINESLKETRSQATKQESARSMKESLVSTLPKTRAGRSKQSKADSTNDLTVAAKKIYLAVRAYHSQICTVMKGKKGFFRVSVLAKRGTQGARAVVSPAIDIEMDEVEIPAYIAETLGRKIVVGEEDIFYMKKIFWDKVNHLNMRTTAFRTLGLMKKTRMTGKETVEIGDEIIRQLMDGDIVLIDRMPTIHKYNMLAFRARIVHGQKTVGVYFGWTGVYGMDFDGDEVSLWVPNDKEVVEEVTRLIGACNNFISVRTSLLNIGITFNALVSWYLATSPETTLEDKYLVSTTYLVDVDDHEEVLEYLYTRERDENLVPIGPLPVMRGLVEGKRKYECRETLVPLPVAKKMSKGSLQMCEGEGEVREYLNKIASSGHVSSAEGISYDLCGDDVGNLFYEISAILDWKLEDTKKAREDVAVSNLLDNYRRDDFDIRDYAEWLRYKDKGEYFDYVMSYMRVLGDVIEMVEKGVSSDRLLERIGKYEVDMDQCRSVKEYLTRVATFDFSYPPEDYSVYHVPYEACNVADRARALYSEKMVLPDSEDCLRIYDDISEDYFEDKVLQSVADLNLMLTKAYYKHINALEKEEREGVTVDNFVSNDALFLRYVIEMVSVTLKARLVLYTFSTSDKLIEIIGVAHTYTDAGRLITPEDMSDLLYYIVELEDYASGAQVEYVRNLIGDLSEEEYERLYDLQQELADVEYPEEEKKIEDLLQRMKKIFPLPTLEELIMVRCYSYILTKDDRERLRTQGKYANPAMSKEEFMRLIGLVKTKSVLERVTGEKGREFRKMCKSYGIGQYSTRALFSALLPEDFTYPSGGGDISGVAIRRGILTQGSQLTGEHLGSGSNSIIYKIFYAYGRDVTKSFIENCYILGDNMMDSGRSFSISYDDCYSEESAKRVSMMKERLAKMESVIALLPKNMSAEKRERKIQESLAQLGTSVTDYIKGQKDKEVPNPVLLTIDGFSQSKGSGIHISQMSLSAGQQFKGTERMGLSLGKGGTRANQADYCREDSLENRGFVARSFAGGLSARETDSADAGSRDAAADSAIRTPESGEIARQLSLSEMDLVGTELNGVKSSSGRLYQPLYGADGFDASKLISLGDCHLPFDLSLFADRLNYENGWYRDLNNEWKEISN